MNARILLIEDEPLIAMEIADALEETGFDVVGVCHTVSHALDRLGEPDCCDAAVLDANLRNISAEPVASALAARSIPFVVVSGYLQSQLPGALAAASLISKPLRTSDLTSQLHKLLAPY